MQAATATPPVIYLDHASAAPLHPAAREAMLTAFDTCWADPGQLAFPHRRAAEALAEAREAVGALLGCPPDSVSFPANGTVAAHEAILGAARARRRIGRGAVHSAVEHSCVLHAVATLEPAAIAVDSGGRVDAEAFTAAVAQPGVVVASLQSANPEVGVCQPVAEVGAACRAAGVPLHVDAAASLGQLPVPEGWDLLSASAHKWGGPPGVGLLVVRPGVRWRSGGPRDDRGGRGAPGYPPVPLVVGAVAALRAVMTEQQSERGRLAALSARLRAVVPATVPETVVLGPSTPEQRLPSVVALTCYAAQGEALVAALDRRAVSAASGSACVASAVEPSHVLAAMGVPTHGNLRLSLGRDTTAAQIERLLAVLPAAVAEARAELSAALPTL